ncbi:hypothetical protein GGR55DRAFT_553387 [Xylaria sp. FL0064]|nr:hypothetical protein GGR55DRAFT_553387 [Xylaria sp. FL0064]
MYLVQSSLLLRNSILQIWISTYIHDQAHASIVPDIQTTIPSIMSQCASGWDFCLGDGLPHDSCCLTLSTCHVLAGDTMLLCCPGDSDCSTIQPIVCNISLQDPAANPEAVVKTTALTATLPTCGDKCCPFGYSCDGNGNCGEDEDQSQKPIGAVSSSSTSVPSSSTTQASISTPTSSIPTSNSALPTNNPTPNHVDDLSSGAKAGIAIGTISGVLLVLAVVFLGYRLHQVKRREERRIQYGNMFERQPQMRASDPWRSPPAVELPVHERRGELEGPEIVRISGLHELDGFPKRLSQVKKSLRRV